VLERLHLRLQPWREFVAHAKKNVPVRHCEGVSLSEMTGKLGTAGTPSSGGGRCRKASEPGLNLHLSADLIYFDAGSQDIIVLVAR
jgi:hypothetical protein